MSKPPPPPPSFARLALAWVVSGPANPVTACVAALRFFTPRFEEAHAFAVRADIWADILFLNVLPCAIGAALALLWWRKSNRKHGDLLSKFSLAAFVTWLAWPLAVLLFGALLAANATTGNWSGAMILSALFYPWVLLAGAPIAALCCCAGMLAAGLVLRPHITAKPSLDSAPSS